MYVHIIYTYFIIVVIFSFHYRCCGCNSFNPFISPELRANICMVRFGDIFSRSGSAKVTGTIGEFNGFQNIDSSGPSSPGHTCMESIIR